MIATDSPDSPEKDKKPAPPDALAQAMQGGIVFRGSKLHHGPSDKVKTKAKKKNYVTGAHGSGSAKKKADIRTRRSNRHKGK